MLNFDTKKKLLKKLHECSERNILMVVPCLIAAGFVRLFYYIACNIDIALSDKNGNFLGIKRREKTTEKQKKKDDIVYVKRPFMGRVVSMVLTAAFLLTFMPVIEIEVHAADDSSIAYTSNATKYTSLQRYKDTTIFPAQITGSDKDHYVRETTSTKELYYDQNQTYVYKNESIDPASVVVTPGRESCMVSWPPLTKDSNRTEYVAVYYTNDSGSGIAQSETYYFSSDYSSVIFHFDDTKGNYTFHLSKVKLMPLYEPSVDTNLNQTVYVKTTSNNHVDYSAEAVTSAVTVDEKVQAPEYSVDYSITLEDKEKVMRATITIDQPALVEGYTPIDGYIIYVKNEDKAGSTYTLKDVVPAGQTTYTITDINELEKTTRYSYMVYSYASPYGKQFTKDSLTKDFIISDNTKPVDILTICDKPASVTAEPGAYNKTTGEAEGTSIVVTWKSVTRATGYNVYRLTNEQFIAFQNTGIIDYDDMQSFGESTTTYTDKYAKRNVRYYYLVTATRSLSNGGDPHESMAAYASCILDPTLSQPFALSGTPDDGKITFTWKYQYPQTISGFDIIPVKVTYDENGVRQETEMPPGARQVGPDTTSYVYDENNVKNGEIYYFKIRPYIIIGKDDPSDGYESKYAGEYIPSSDFVVGTDFLTPQDLIAEPGDGEVQVTWSAVSKATGYHLYIAKLDENGNFVDIENLPITCTKPEYLHKNLKNGETYRYYVIAYKTVHQENEYTNPSTAATATVGVYFGTPTNITATSSDGEITLKWQAVKDADWYTIHALKLGDEDAEPLVFRSDKNSYVHTGLTYGETWSYYVVPHKNVPSIWDENSTPGGKSDTVTATVGESLMAPADLTAVGDDGMITLKWTAVKGAQRYYVYARNVTTNGSVISYETTKTTYVHTGLKNGDTWEYYIVAYKTVRTDDGNEHDVLSPQSNIASATVGVYLMKPADLTATAGESEIEISWSAVSGADGYTLYASDGFNNLSFDVTKTKFTHTGLNAGVVWTYYVVPYKTVDGQKYTGPQSEKVSASVSTYLTTPKDFTVSSVDSSAVLKWSAVKGAEGYVVTAYKSGASYDFDVSKTTYTHTGLVNGDTWNYYVRAYKTVNGVRVYSDPTITLSVRIGASLSAPIDLVATSGNRQIDLSWSAVKGAEGYVVYLYDEGTATFLPLSVVSKTKFSHTGLNNGQKYTYMVAAYKTLSGERVYGDYSMAVDAIPSAGSAADLDTIINIKGTAPYGISHSELISAVANHEAFDESVDCYFSTNEEATNAIKEVLRHYANGLSSFIIYPFDISLYRADTLIAVEPNPGFSITFTMPIPDKLVPYRDYITVVHLPTDGTEIINDRDYDNEDGIFIDATDLEVLPSAVIQLNGRWCIQFSSSSASPFALVIYKDAIDDISSSASAAGGSFAGNFDTGVLLFTALPDIMPAEKKTRFVVSTKKYYRIKK
ncbi:MAG: hypothetical protein ACI4JF_01875 [Oscillospiraceae bacterium]